MRKTFSQLVWEIPATEKDIYLTFDDGPTPEITSQVLALLFQYKAKATFFCLGAKIEQYPHLFQQIKAAGHVVGNHGYEHRSGFSTSQKKYVENARHGEEISGGLLFRPPYGRITPWQSRELRDHYKIIMWSIMSMDFDAHTTPEQCFLNCIQHIKPGSIIVFHDMEKAKNNVLTVLPRLLEWMNAQGYIAKALDDELLVGTTAVSKAP